MRTWANLSLWVSALLGVVACGSDNGAATIDANPSAEVDAAPPAPDAAACVTGETTCGELCIEAGGFCAQAVAPETALERRVWLNGATFKRLRIGSATGIQKVHVADALVAFQADGADHLWVEVPPGTAGLADVTVETANAKTVTKRVLEYRSGSPGQTWTTKTMESARGGFPAMVTTFDDRVLVAGGYTAPDTALDNCTDSADLFSRATTASTKASNTMSTKRWTATAVTLPSGRSVVAGACYIVGCKYDSTKIDLFDPKTNNFTPAQGKFAGARGFLRSLLLADGRALFVSNEAPSIAIYDPVLDSVSTIAGSVFSAPSPVTGHIARLRDGNVLLVPGGGRPNVIFNPVTKALAPTGDNLPHVPDALVPLADGRVLAIGGQKITGTGAAATQAMVDTISVFDPQTKKFTAWTQKLVTGRNYSTVIMARNGTIYVIGGWSGSGKLSVNCSIDADLAGLTLLRSVEIIDPAGGTVTPGPDLPEANLSLRSTILSDGSIIAGGGTPCGSAAVSYASVYYLEAPPIN